MTEAHEDRNPYESPEADLANPTIQESSARSEWGRFGLRDLDSESEILTVGSLFQVGAYLVWCVYLAGVLSGFTRRSRAELIANAAAALILMAALYVLGMGLRGLRSWAQGLVVSFSTISIIVFIIVGVFAYGVRPRRIHLDLSTLIVVIVLFSIIPSKLIHLLLKPRIKRLFRRDYRDLVQGTPWIKHHQSLFSWKVWAFLAILQVAFIFRFR